MSDSMEATNLNSATAQDLADAIQELEQYRERLVGDLTAAAQKAKVSRSSLASHLDPELAKIDAALDRLRTQYAALTDR